jgi:hypothetical protein
VSSRSLLEAGYTSLLEQITLEFARVLSAVKNKEMRLKEELKRIFAQKTAEYDLAVNDLAYLKSCMREYKNF